MDVVKKAGVERVFVPAGQESAWKAAGIDVQAFQVSKFVKLPSPGVERRMNVAAATSMPWVDANGWRLERDGRLLELAPAPLSEPAGCSPAAAAAERPPMAGAR